MSTHNSTATISTIFSILAANRAKMTLVSEDDKIREENAKKAMRPMFDVPSAERIMFFMWTVLPLAVIIQICLAR